VSRRWRALALSALGAAAVLALAVWWAWRDMEQSLDRPLELAAPSLFEIKPGTSLAGLAGTFVERGWLAHALHLRIEAERAGLAGRIQAGHYEVSSRDTPRGLLRRFAAGDVKTYSVTFVEGSTFAEIRRQTAKLPGLVLELSDASPGEVASALGITGESPEGWLFPSTYHYRHAATDRELWQRAHRKMQAVLSRLWEGRAADLPYATPHDALVMASIVEKETGRAEERDAIAGVFVRRLQRNMRLQTDPTVIYGLGDAFDGDLRRADLARDTPWNTYTRHGLPPTAICSPGEAALRASLAPADGEALYFVARGDGSHVFSKTLEAHNAAVREYQLRGNGR
jgi:UPF0755 protein